MKIEKIAFLGAGNMAEALVKGLVASGLCTPARIVVADVDSRRLDHFHREYSVRGVTSNLAAVMGADVVMLSIKPQILPEVLKEVAPVLEARTLVLSIAAGVTTAKIEGVLGEGVRVVRSMPNTPALVRAGAAAICGGRWAEEKDLETAEQILRAVGVVVRVQELDMDAVTALSGSGPAYVFFMMEALLEAARRLQLDEDIARPLVYATIEGAARLIQETGVEAGELRQRVTSKGGTTAAALEVLRNRNVSEAFCEAVLAAHKRSRELSGA